MTAGVLVIGESVLDIVRDADGVREHPGGSPLNVACGLARFGVEVRLLTSLGKDRAGDAIQLHLAAAGVTLVEGSVGIDRTSTAVATIGTDGSADYEFDIAWSLPAASAVGSANWVHVGSLATFLTPGADYLERFLGSLPRDSVISYDPNIRPRLLGDHAVAVARFERFVALADVVKLSDEDAIELYPDLPQVEVLPRILELGASVVALTRGAEGACLATAASAFSVQAVQVDVIDTIGAGDSFMAALIAELSVGELPPTRARLEEAAHRAATAAALTCARAGASSPTLRELLEAM